jgi:hypothetical protein
VSANDTPDYCTGWGRAQACPRRHQCQRFLDGQQVGGYQPVSRMDKPESEECPAYKPVRVIAK